VERFQDQTAIITGGAQGLGLGIAERMGSEGARIALVDRNEKQLGVAQQTLESKGVTALAITADITDREAVERAVEAAVARFGGVEVLVTAAGITGQTHQKPHEVEPEDFDRVMNTNLRGMFLCIRAVLPHMLKADYGRIVNIASIAGKEGNAGMLAYSASKAAVIGLTKSIGKDYARTGITCNAIAPALVRTAMTDAFSPEEFKNLIERIPMGRTGEIAEIAAVVAFAASREAAFTTGFVFDASGGRALY